MRFRWQEKFKFAFNNTSECKFQTKCCARQSTRVLFRAFIQMSIIMTSLCHCVDNNRRVCRQTSHFSNMSSNLPIDCDPSKLSQFQSFKASTIANISIDDQSHSKPNKSSQIGHPFSGKSPRKVVSTSIVFPLGPTIDWSRNDRLIFTFIAPDHQTFTNVIKKERFV